MGSSPHMRQCHQPRSIAEFGRCMPRTPLLLLAFRVWIAGAETRATPSATFCLPHPRHSHCAAYPVPSNRTAHSRPITYHPRIPETPLHAVNIEVEPCWSE